MSATFCFGEGGAKFFYAGVEICGNRSDFFGLVIEITLDWTAGATLPDRSGAVVEALEVDADFVFFGGPGFSHGVAAFASAIFTAEFYDCLVSRRSEEMQSADEAGVLREGKLA